MTNMIESLSGTHPSKTECVVTSIVEEWMLDGIDAHEQAVRIAAQIRDDLADGRCPRCRGPLPEPPELPAGSRVTPCRCAPICGRCGSDEANQAILGRGISQFWRWPVRKGDITKRAIKVEAMCERTPAVVAATGDDLVALTDAGVTTLRPRPHPGGWFEFGHDDDA